MAVPRNPDLQFISLARENVDELAPALSRLDLDVRDRHVGEAYWRWCYLDNPAGPAIVVVATCQGAVVGRHGCIPLRMTVAGNRVTAYLMEGLSLLPEHRNWVALRGLLHGSLVAAEPDVPIAFAFATPMPAEFHRLMGLEVRERLPIFVGLNDAAHALQSRRVPRLLSVLLGQPAQRLLGVRRGAANGSMEIADIATFDASFDELWSVLEADRRVAVVKDARYLNWRYACCPSVDYGRIGAWCHGRLEGLAVWRVDRGKRHGFLLELLARDDDPEVLEQLVGEVLQRMSTEELGLISASFPRGSAPARALRRARFNAWASRLRNMSLIVTIDPDWVHRPEAIMQPWSYSFGDWLFH